jgi:hypothetical protein
VGLDRRAEFALMDGHVYKFGPSLEQGCQCAACKRRRLDYAAPHLAEALDRLLTLITIAAVDRIPIKAEHPAVLEARSALAMVEQS